MKKSSDIIKETKKNLKLHRERRKTELTRNLDVFVYWTSLALLALFNLIAVFFLIPFLMFFNEPSLLIAVGSFGMLFGFLFNLLIMGIEHLKQRHSIIAGFFIPVLAVLDISLILGITQKISSILVRPINYNVSLVIIVFISSFVAPYLLAVVTGKHRA